MCKMGEIYVSQILPELGPFHIKCIHYNFASVFMKFVNRMGYLLQTFFRYMYLYMYHNSDFLYRKHVPIKIKK